MQLYCCTVIEVGDVEDDQRCGRTMMGIPWIGAFVNVLALLGHHIAHQTC